jgi:hypothetical protein
MILLTSNVVFAQGKFTMKGYVKDSLSGETLIGASIFIQDETRGVTTSSTAIFRLRFQRKLRARFSYGVMFPK